MSSHDRSLQFLVLEGLDKQKGVIYSKKFCGAAWVRVAEGFRLAFPIQSHSLRGKIGATGGASGAHTES